MLCISYMYDNNICRLMVTLLLENYKALRGVYLAVTAPVCVVTVPFVHVWMISYGP